MITSVNTIKRLLWMMLGISLLTYLISINMENHFVAVNTKWLSNDFLFAITVGVFASLVIVLVCEIIRYKQMKNAAENVLLMNFGNLYGQFLIIRSNCVRALNSKEVVSDNLILSTCNNANMIVDSIHGMDYTLFCKNNKANQIWTHFKTDKYLALKNVLINFAFLRIAIWEDGKVLLSQGKQNLVTSECENTNKALNKIVNQSNTILTYLDQIIIQLDDALGKRYDWQKIKQSLNAYQDNYIGQRLDDYLKEDVVIF